MGRSESVAAVLVIAVVSGVVWWWPRAEPVVTPVAVLEERPRGTVTVHVSGAVARTGVVVLVEGSRVVDAVAAAGGITPDADLDRVNLAAVLVDGGQVVVPAIGSEPASDPGDGRVPVNTATLAELQTLPGVGPVTAARIVDHREEVGGFTVVEDLLDVAGIGEATLERLRPLVRIP